MRLEAPDARTKLLSTGNLTDAFKTGLCKKLVVVLPVLAEGFGYPQDRSGCGTSATATGVLVG
jgi:hypothetical protein